MALNEQRTLGVLDYAVVGLMLACSLSIGMYQAHKARKKKQGADGYLMGNRSMKLFPVAISMAVNFKSAVTILGVPADAYQYGLIYSWCLLGMFAAGPIVCYAIIPVLYNLKIHSAYEYLEKRYGRPIRMLATSGFLVQTLLYMGVNIYGPALALSRVTGFSQVPAMLTTGIVCMTYTALGGLRGVIWSDVFQACVMVAAMLAFLIRGTVVAGGVGAVWEQMMLGGRNTLMRFDFDPRIRYTFWTQVVGGALMWSASMGANQTNVQRFLSVNSVKKARWSMLIGCMGVVIMTGLAIGCGIVLYALFHSCDPMASGCITSRDEMMPFAALDIFRPYPGMTGLLLAGVFAASLSTVSSGLNAMVLVIVTDILKPYTTRSDSRYVQTSKVLTVCLGFAIIGCGFLISTLGQILPIAVSVIGSVTGALFGIILMGIWLPFVNIWGSAAGFVSGVVGSFVRFIGSRGLKKPDYLTRKLPISTSFCPADCGFIDSLNITTMANLGDFNSTTTVPEMSLSGNNEHELSLIENYYSLSYFYATMLALLYTLLVGIAVSLVTGGWQQRHSVDKRTIETITCSRLIKCLPATLQKLCACAVDDDSVQVDQCNNESKQDESIPLSGISGA